MMQCPVSGKAKPSDFLRYKVKLLGCLNHVRPLSPLLQVKQQKNQTKTKKSKHKKSGRLICLPLFSGELLYHSGQRVELKPLSPQLSDYPVIVLKVTHE